MEQEALLEKTISQIKPPDEAARAACKRTWDTMGKPLHSLGKLETLMMQLAAIQRSVHPHIEKRALVVMCADNGVVAEGVTQTGQEVTAIVAENFFDDLTCTSLICKKNHCDQFIVDIGMAADTPRTIRRKVAYGTKNMVQESAMTREEARQAIETGISMALQLKDEGYQIIATGEMGIGNTTTSSAITAVFLGQPVETVTGRGAGLSNDGLERKYAAISRAIEKNRPNPKDPLDVVAKVGGFDLAGLAGVYIGGAAAGIPVVIDGFISLAAALLAARIAPESVPYMIPSHQSAEPGARLILEELGLKPGICMDMCLGEGSGAVALFSFLDMAADIYGHMGTFADIHVEAYEDYTD